MRPRIFVGSSSEAMLYDQLVREVLEAEGLEPVAWNGSFRPGEYGLDSLDRIVRESDGALLILSADDRTMYRGEETFSPRDNVLLELGYFLQAFGRRRTAIIHVQSDSGEYARTPTDLAGLMSLRFRTDSRASNAAEIRRWCNDFLRTVRSTDPVLKRITSVLNGPYRDLHQNWGDSVNSLVLEPIYRSALAALRGELLLTPGQYYNLLDQEISEAAQGTTVLAVSTVSSQVHLTDRDQQEYFRLNIDAATRGADIRRLFVLPEEYLYQLRPVMELQQRSGISVRVALPGASADFSTLDDVVLFTRTNDRENYIRGYVGYPVFDNPGRIRSGKLLLDTNSCRAQADAFEAAWAISFPIDRAPFFSPASKRGYTGAGRPSPTPPGEALTASWLPREVITCKEAAAARNIALRNELKTMILRTSSGLVAAHVPGDCKIDLRAVREIMEVDRAFIAPISDLKNLGLDRGTVSPVLNPVWSLPHLIDRRVMKLNFVAANNGTTTGHFRFTPAALLAASSYTLADFAQASGRS
jgi:prolyl-tRNA editing enzyme YbaK/EbsC (Cys-tRNA(Pro) deacylase)